MRRPPLAYREPYASIFQANKNMNQSDYNTITAMQERGGNFVQKLAAAYIAADDDNRARIRTAFSDIWARYCKMGETTAKP